jgi:hypothetical protein
MAKKKPDDGLTADELKEVQTFETNVEREEAKEAASPALEAKKRALQHPVIEFPKMVKGRSFQTRAEQDAAGPEFAD